MKNQFSSASFQISCASPEQFPPPEGPEVAFAGRSNAGKSSTLNKLCRRKGLAHVSKTPGRTQLINFFELNNGARLVDLPGYGYAKVPEAERRKWGYLIEAYLNHRVSLQGLVIVMDIRHPLTDYDWIMLDWCESAQIPAHILLNKSDKLKRGAIAKTRLEVIKQVSELTNDLTVQSFSASKGEGLEQLQDQLDLWLLPETEPTPGAGPSGPLP